MEEMKVAVVSGSSSGIGRAVAERLIENNYKVYGISRGAPDFSHPRFVFIQADLRAIESYPLIGSSIPEERVDLLVNNAGVAFEGTALEFTQSGFDSTFDVNFKAPILLTKTLQNKLQKGEVINISSVSDRLVGEGYALYCSSKAALNTYFQVVALEEKEIKIVSVLPSYVDTPLLRRLQKGVDFQWHTTVKPEQIAEFILRIVRNDTLQSGAKIIVVSDSLKEDLEYNEDLWGYNVSTRELIHISGPNG